MNLQKYVRLALNNSNENESRTAARMFFKKLKAADMRFNSPQWGLNRADALRLMELGGVQIKVANQKPCEGKVEVANRKATLKDVLEGLDIDPAKARRILRKVFGKRGTWVFNHDEFVLARTTLLNRGK